MATIHHSSQTWRVDKYDVLLFGVVVVHVLAAPHTKVEEIFQVNNIHDHLYLGAQLQDYDFVEFPGVVYRTFISSLMIAFVASPFKFLVEAMGGTSFHMLIVCRVLLGCLNLLALKFLRHHIQLKYRDAYVTSSFVLVTKLFNILDLCSAVPHHVLHEQTPAQHLRLDIHYCGLGLLAEL